MKVGRVTVPGESKMRSQARTASLIRFFGRTICGVGRGLLQTRQEYQQLGNAAICAGKSNTLSFNWAAADSSGEGKPAYWHVGKSLQKMGGGWHIELSMPRRTGQISRGDAAISSRALFAIQAPVSKYNAPDKRWSSA